VLRGLLVPEFAERGGGGRQPLLTEELPLWKMRARKKAVTSLARFQT